MRERRNKTEYLLRASVAILLAVSVCTCGVLAVSSAYFGESEKRSDRQQAYFTARSVADAAVEQLSEFEGELSQQLYGLAEGEQLELGAVEGLAPEMGSCTLRLVREAGGAAVEAIAVVEEETALCRAELKLGLLDLSGGALNGVEEISLGEVCSPLDGFAAQSDVSIGESGQTVRFVGTEQLPLSLVETLYSASPLSIQAEQGSVIRGGVVSTQDVELAGALTVGDGQQGVTTSGKLVIRGGVTIKGDICAEEVVLEGDGTLRVEGAIEAKTVSLTGGAITGRIAAESLTVGAGGSVMSEELLARQIVLNGDGKISTGTTAVIQAESVALRDQSTFYSGSTFLVNSINCSGESVLSGTVDVSKVFFEGAACASGRIRTMYFSFAPDWTGSVEGTLICAQPFEGLSREQVIEVPGTEDTTSVSADEVDEVKQEEENASASQGIVESQDPLAGDGELKSEHVKGTITLEPNLALGTVTVTLPEHELVTLPLLREPAVPSYELLPNSVCKTIGGQREEIVGLEQGDSYYQVRGNTLSELVVRGTGNVYLYLCEGSEIDLSSVRYEAEKPTSNLFLIVEKGANLNLSLPEGDSFYGYVYSEKGGEVRLVTGGRTRRQIIGGLHLTRTEGAEESAISGVEVIPVEPQTQQGTLKKVLFWQLTGHTSQDDLWFGGER